MNWVVLLSLIPHFTGSLSVIGSSAIIYMVLSDREKKLLIPKHRLMLAMSVYDVIQSLALAMSTLPFPKEYSDVYSYGAIGNMTTCKIQYFFVTLGLAVPMYNASLCLFYYLTIRHRWRQKHFATKIEPFLHIGACLIPLVAAIGPVAMDNVSPTSRYCTVSTSSYSAVAFTCISIYVAAIPALSFLICVYTMASISIFVHLQWKKMLKYTYNARQEQRQRSEKWKTIQQAMLYTAAFALTFLFPCILVTWNAFALEILSNMFYPLQGFWNFFLYIRPGVIKIKKIKPDKCFCEIIWLVIFRSNIEKRLNNRCGISSPRERKRGKKIGSEENYNETSDRSKNPHSEQVRKEMRTGNEENLNEISDDSPRLSVDSQLPLSIASNNYTQGCSPVFNHRNCNLDVSAACTNQTEDDPKVESGNDDESYGQCMGRRRSSLVFATALDDASFNSFDSQQSAEDCTLEDCRTE